MALALPASRKMHRWLALGATAPLPIVVVTGLLLSLRQELPWVQPPALAGTPGFPRISVAAAFDVARSVKEAEIESWKDLASIDVRPGKGTLAFRTKRGFEVQIDGADGRVLSAARRRTAWLIELHQGSLIHPWVSKGIFVPCAVALLILWFTGARLLIGSWR